jgi:hypothetical protein
MGNKQSTKKKEKTKSYLLQTCEEHEGSLNCMDVSEDGTHFKRKNQILNQRSISHKSMKEFSLSIHQITQRAYLVTSFSI